MNAEFEKEMGERLKQLRIEKGYTQEQISAQMQVRGCDVTRSALAKIEVGQRHIYVDELKILKEILETTFDYLFS